MDHKTANAVLDNGPKDINQVHGLDVVDGHTVEGPVVGSLTGTIRGHKQLKALVKPWIAV